MYAEIHFLIIISWLLESICLCPKVIPLSSFYCITNFFNKIRVEHKRV